jgi:hypothetical protein
LISKLIAMVEMENLIRIRDKREEGKAASIYVINTGIAKHPPSTEGFRAQLQCLPCAAQQCVGVG